MQTSMEGRKEGRIPEECAKSIIITMPKKRDLGETQCSNYITISLLNRMAKVLTMVLLEKTKSTGGVIYVGRTAGFIKDRNTIQQILILRLIAEKSKRKERKVYHYRFIDFHKALEILNSKTSHGRCLNRTFTELARD